MAKKNSKKAPLKKVVAKGNVWAQGPWVVRRGELKRNQGNPGIDQLFRCVAEKLPYASLAAAKKVVTEEFGYEQDGVYIAHDSMGCPRYIGRGKIFSRLAAHKKSHPNELAYFSIYIVTNKKHEREVETLLIRGSSFLLEFNDRKKRVGTQPGDVKDYEAGTHFLERQLKKGKKS